METSKRISHTLGLGDAAVEGLMFGILAGIVMGAFVLAVEFVAGKAPGTVLGYFDAGSQASPMIGSFTHIAVSGIYGVVFGVVYLVSSRILGARSSLGMWLLLGAVYGALIFGIAEGIVLPRTNSPLRELPVWVFATAHVLYGVALAWLTGRNL